LGGPSEAFNIIKGGVDFRGAEGLTGVGIVKMDAKMGVLVKAVNEAAVRDGF